MSTESLTVPFGEWLPDLPEHENPGTLIAKNVIPQLGSYRSINSLAAFSDALVNACLGTFWVNDDTGFVYNFAGDINKLYQLQNSVNWVDVSGVGAPYNAKNWDFTKFGNRVIAASKADNLQYWDLGISSTFADLPGSPPKAKAIATVRDFIMLGDIEGLGSNHIQWSAYNNSELWAPSLATQADFQALSGRAGAVQRIVPGEVAFIFCEQSIFSASYAPPPIIFQIDEIERKRGTPSPNSVAWTGGLMYYFGWDGFYVFDGRMSTPISHNKVSKWFTKNASADVYDDMRVAVDRLNRLVIWAFKSSASSPINDRLIIYNWASKTQNWGYAEVDTQVIDEYVSPGLTLDELDGPLPGGIDLDSINVDSDFYAGGTINLQAFNATNQASTFSGAPLTAYLDTKEISSIDNRRVITNNVRPLVEGNPNTQVQIQVGKRDELKDNVVYTLAKPPNPANNMVNVRANSRYQRFRTIIDGGFTHGKGVKIDARYGGMRG